MGRRPLADRPAGAGLALPVGTQWKYHFVDVAYGLIVEVPAAEHAVADWRKQLDPQATLVVPAHVTVLFPFVAPDRIDEAILTALRKILTAVEPFKFRLAQTG